MRINKFLLINIYSSPMILSPHWFSVLSIADALQLGLWFGVGARPCP